MNQSAARRSTEVPVFKVMVPVSGSGIDDLIARERGRGTLIRVVPVICATKNGCITKKVLKVAKVSHKKGGGYMLPQLEFRPKTTPYESVRDGLAGEMRVSVEQLQHVNRSTVILGTHLHHIPANRTKHVSEVGSEVRKLLVFTKVCVDPNFRMENEDLKAWAWISSLQQAVNAMAGMRDPTKRDAELDAIRAATEWEA